MKKTFLLKTVLLLCALIAGSSSSWADEITYTFTTKDWNASPSNWTSGKDGGGFSNNGVQVTTSSSGANATSPISFNAISKIVVTYNTNKSAGAGSIEVKVGDNDAKKNTVGYSGSDDGRTANFKTQFDFSPTQTGTVKLTVNTTANSIYVCSIAITYTASSTPSSAVSFATSKPSIDWPTTLTYTQTANTADGYASTPGASVTYSIGATNTANATINTSTGEVTPAQPGNVIVVATAAAIDGQFTESSDSYTLVVNDVRETATLSWSENYVEIFKDASSYSLPTLNNPNSLDVTYTVEGTTGLASVTSAGVVTVNTGTVGTATVKASFAGNNSYKPKSATYTIDVVDPTVKGSKYNPYTVAEVIAAAPSSTSSPASGQGDVYVIGYIVGGYNSNSSFTTKSSEFQTSNIALADDPSNTSSNIPVQMPNNAIRTNFNVVDNPYHVGSTQVLLKGDILKYFTKPGIKNVDEMTAIAIDITIGTSGYTTLGRDFKLDHLKATATGVYDELEAYVVTAVSASAATLEAIPHIPAGEGVILKGTPGTTYTIPVFDHGHTVSTNLLLVSDGKVKGSDGSIYALADKSGTVGFYKVADAVTIPAGKCYLDTATPAPDYLGFDFGATGISEELRVKSEEFATAPIYNLAGQRVAQPTKGLYIVNGKKVVLK